MLSRTVHYLSINNGNLRVTFFHQPSSSSSPNDSKVEFFTCFILLFFFIFSDPLFACLSGFLNIILPPCFSSSTIKNNTYFNLLAILLNLLKLTNKQSQYVIGTSRQALKTLTTPYISYISEKCYSMKICNDKISTIPHVSS